MKAIGLDFGTESVRAISVDVATGAEGASAVEPYEHGVIDNKYHDPDDYVRAMHRVLAAVGPADAIGVAATACSVLPCKADGTPLSRLSKHPQALVKIWKNHDSQPFADRLNAVAAERKEPWLRRYGKISSEWFFPKVWQTLEEAPEVYHSADRFIEKADWIVWQLTGHETRNACTAGYKAMWHKRDGFPSRDFFAALNPELADVVDRKLSRTIQPIGARAGTWKGIPVAVGTIDAHAAVPAAGIATPGIMLLVMGTSLCHMVLGEQEVPVEGICGVVEDGILPGFFGYEAGQSAVGDIFAWFTRAFDVPHEASPGPSRLVALDWWNGCRELQNADLSGLIMGLTLDTKPAEIYRALVEATAFGTRRIIEAHERAGVAVRELRACGGIPEQNPLVMQVFADVTGRSIRIARSPNATAVGAALLGAKAAGLPTECMSGLRETAFHPDPARHAAYNGLFKIFNELHATFGDGRLMAALKGR